MPSPNRKPRSIGDMRASLIGRKSPLRYTDVIVSVPHSVPSCQIRDQRLQLRDDRLALGDCQAILSQRVFAADAVDTAVTREIGENFPRPDIAEQVASGPESQIGNDAIGAPVGHVCDQEFVAGCGGAGDIQLANDVGHIAHANLVTAVADGNGGAPGLFQVRVENAASGADILAAHVVVGAIGGSPWTLY